MNRSVMKALILGAGRGAANVLEILVRQGTEVEGILDDRAGEGLREAAGIPVLGPLSEAAVRTGPVLVWGLGNPDLPWLRLEIAARLGVPLERYETVIHASATVSEHARTGRGATIQAGARIAAGAVIGAHAGVGYNSVVEHDAVIGAGTLLASGVLLAGGVEIGPACYIGQGAGIRGGVRIGTGAFIGMGAVVLEDVADGEVVAGVPARVMRTVARPDGLDRWIALARPGGEGGT